jgi:hypothetical protein
MRRQLIEAYRYSPACRGILVQEQGLRAAVSILPRPASQSFFRMSQYIGRNIHRNNVAAQTNALRDHNGLISPCHSHFQYDGR